MFGRWARPLAAPEVGGRPLPPVGGRPLGVVLAGGRLAGEPLRAPGPGLCLVPSSPGETWLMCVGPLAFSRVVRSMVHYDAPEVGAPDDQGVGALGSQPLPRRARAAVARWRPPAGYIRARWFHEHFGQTSTTYTTTSSVRRHRRASSVEVVGQRPF